MAEPFEKVSCRKHGEVVLSSNQVPETNKTAAGGRPLSMAEFHLSLFADSIFEMPQTPEKEIVVLDVNSQRAGPLFSLLWVLLQALFSDTSTHQ